MRSLIYEKLELPRACLRLADKTGTTFCRFLCDIDLCLDAMFTSVSDMLDIGWQWSLAPLRSVSYSFNIHPHYTRTQLKKHLNTKVLWELYCTHQQIFTHWFFSLYNNIFCTLLMLLNFSLLPFLLWRGGHRCN